MNVTREEAAEALTAIDRAGEKVWRLQGYRYGAPFFILWGLIWAFANSVTQFWPQYGNIVWPVSAGVGGIVSIVLGVAQGYRAFGRNRAPHAGGRVGWRIGVTSLIMFVFIATLIAIAQPESSRQGNAMVSVFFPFLYMAAGVWSGWRLFAIGFVTAAAILFGYVYVQEYFDLWMAVFGGGSLIAGGIWLRTA